MQIITSLEELRQKAVGYRAVPVAGELFSDVRTPIEVLRILKNVSSHCFLFESVENQEIWGRYTFLGFDPKEEIAFTGGKNPRGRIEEVLKEYKSPRMENLPSFTGGLVGYFSYDYVKYSNPKLKLDAKDEEGFKDVDVMLFDKVIAFDNVKQKIIIMVTVKTDELEKNYENAVQTIKKIAKLIIRGEMKKEQPGCLKTEFKPLFQKDEYCRMVEKAKEYIYQGDIFQVVLSNRLEAEYEGSLLNTYRIMRTTNPSPYMFYFSSDDMEVAGASPETLVKLENGVLHTFPLAGTRPRGKDRQEDLALEEDLLADEKECAEHNMLVDLGRNDIGKISKFGTVEVEEYMQVLRYSHVMHIGSTVRGQIRDDKTALDAVEAVLTAGTLSGAPKYRAMEIINELENNKRGIYGGAVGYLDFTGNLDTCIGIRLAYKKNGKVFVRSGAGIVADSVPEKEFQLIGTIEPDIKVIRNDEMTVEEVKALNPQLIILSPGPGRPDQAGICEEVVKKLGSSIPILGVCLGHQAICEAYGGKIIHAKKLMHGKTSIARLDRSRVLFKEMDAEIKVARYHSLEADPDTLPAELFVTAMADGEIMAVEHKKYPVYGLQFHPESILTPKGIDILRNVVESIRK